MNGERHEQTTGTRIANQFSRYFTEESKDGLVLCRLAQAIDDAIAAEVNEIKNDMQHELRRAYGND